MINMIFFVKLASIFWLCHTQLHQKNGTESCYILLVKANNEKQAKMIFFNWVFADIKNKGAVVYKQSTSIHRTDAPVTIKDYPFKSWKGK